MAVAQDRRRDHVAERMRRDQPGQFGVQVIHIGQSAAEDDGIGIEQVDHHRQAAGQPVVVAGQGLGRRLVAGGGPVRQATGVVGAGR
jgi:hypothetical protein